MRMFIAVAFVIATGTGLVMSAQPSGRPANVPLSAAEMEQMLFNQRNPAPGLYTFQPLHSKYCVRVDLDVFNALNPPSFRLGMCPGTVIAPHPHEYFAVIPTPDYDFTIRRNIPELSDNRLHTCATVARNLIVGPARIDALTCDVPPGATNWGAAGGHDQRFRFRQVEAMVYEVLTPNGECWDVRNQGVEGDLIRWQCNQQSNQRFEFTYRGPLPPEEGRFLAASGWKQGPDGMRRANPVRNIDLRGQDYASFDTADDGGRACAARCVDEAQCRAYSWVRPGVQGASARCWLKNLVPPAARDSNTASGVIR